MEIVRRAFDNTLANWPLLLIRIAESVVLALVFIGGAFAIAGPMIFSAISSGFDPETFEPDRLVEELILGHPFLIAWLIVGLTLLLIAALAVHSFVQAGSMGVYVDGERLAGAGAPRSAFRAFAPDRWIDYGRRFWWPVFLVYNISWGLYGLVLLVPLVVLAVAVFAARNSDAVVPLACGGLVLIFTMLFVGGFLVTVWCDLAIAESLRSGSAAAVSLRRAGTALRRFFGEVVLVVAVLLGLSILGMALFLGVYFVMGLGSSVPGLSLVFFPAQIFFSFAQTAFNVILSSWFIAAFAGIILKGEARQHAS